MDDTDMPEAQRLNESLDNLVVQDWYVVLVAAGVGTRASSSRGMVLPWYPIKVLVSDIGLSPLKVIHERPNATWICGLARTAPRERAALYNYGCLQKLLREIVRRSGT